MASSALIIILPVDRAERCAGIDLRANRLKPDSDRRNVIELWRVRALREIDQLCERKRWPHDEQG